PELAARGLDPLPTYTPPHEDPQTRPDLAARFPLQMVSPPHPSFLNSTFVNIKSLREQAGAPTIEIHPHDAASRGIEHGQWGRVAGRERRGVARPASGCASTTTAAVSGRWHSSERQ